MPPLGLSVPLLSTFKTPRPAPSTDVSTSVIKVLVMALSPDNVFSGAVPPNTTLVLIKFTMASVVKSILPISP